MSSLTEKQDNTSCFSVEEDILNMSAANTIRYTSVNLLNLLQLFSSFSRLL